MSKYENCEHFWVTTDVDFVPTENNLGKFVWYCGCLKCGLDERVLRKRNSKLSLEEEEMVSYMKANPKYLDSGYDSVIKCDLEVATEAYNKIVRRHPNMNDSEVERATYEALGTKAHSVGYQKVKSLF